MSYTKFMGFCFHFYHENKSHCSIPELYADLMRQGRWQFFGLFNYCHQGSGGRGYQDTGNWKRSMVPDGDRGLKAARQGESLRKERWGSLRQFSSCYWLAWAVGFAYN